MMKTTIVIVIYKVLPEYSRTLCSLFSILETKKNDNMSVIIYDNSPDIKNYDPGYHNINSSYKHDPRNLGITAAYNYAFAEARENGSEWLLLLDHDTELTEEYIDKVMNMDEKDKKVAAVVPKINCENQMISPVYSNTLRPLQGDKPAAGIQEKPVMAINSGALIRMSFLNEIGGFNEEFPLDYLDHWLFYEIYVKAYRVRILNVSLEHELSVMDYSRVSLTRYKSILESEIRFYKKYKKDLYKPYRIQLAKRFLKQVLTVKNKRIALYTLQRLFSM